MVVTVMGTNPRYMMPNLENLWEAKTKFYLYDSPNTRDNLIATNFSAKCQHGEKEQNRGWFEELISSSGIMNKIELKNYKEFVMLYNKMVSECFKSCITSFNEGRLTADEHRCVNECVNKMVNVNHRIMSVFMEIGPPADKEMGMGRSTGSLTR